MNVQLRPFEIGAFSTQEQAMAALERKGFHFLNWIPAEPDANGGNAAASGAQCAVMGKRSKHGTEYREVDQDGRVN